jgi:hypothetical protein
LAGAGTSKVPVMVTGAGSTSTATTTAADTRTASHATGRRRRDGSRPLGNSRKANSASPAG